MATQFSCPSCGAPVVFVLKSTVFSVCRHCQTAVVRKGVDLEAIGKVAELMDEHSPLQLGATGRYDGREFRIVGRVRWSWADGAWNEWLIDLGSGRSAWLVEAQGQFAVVEPGPRGATIPERASLRLGDKYALGGREYVADDVKQVAAAYVEGELPEATPVGHRKTAADFSAPDGGMASIDYEIKGSGASLWIGAWVPLADLRVDGLRVEPEGGTRGDSTGVQSYQCASCGAPIAMRLGSLHAVSVACGHCNAILDANDPGHKIISKAAERAVVTPLIPLGAFGKLQGVKWQLVGFMRRATEDGDWFWDEYLLFDAKQGFRWLVENQGHWTLLKQTKQAPKVEGDRAEFLDGYYRLYSRGKCVVRFVRGEFPWRVRLGETAWATEFIQPPQILAREVTKLDGGDDITWTIGEHIDGRQVADAFKGMQALPRRSGVGPCEPSPYGRSLGSLWRSAGLLIAALTVLQLGSCMATADSSVHEATYDYDAAKPATVKTEPFDLGGDTANVEIDSSGSVDNNWLSLTITLVNAQTEDTQAIEQGIEYYHGYDSDGSWSEGSLSAETTLSSVPKGRYYLTIAPQAGAGVGKTSYRVKVRRDVPDATNWLACLLLLLAMPALLSVRAYFFEVKRWSTSDYTPYQTG
jgi:hypothetical protein